MKKCINCGSLENNNSFVCRKCGSHLIDEYSNQCSNCGNIVKVNERFCPVCGIQIFAENPKLMSEPKSEKKSKLNVLLWIILITLIIGCVFVAILLLNYDKKTDTNNTADVAINNTENGNNTEKQDTDYNEKNYEKEKVSSYSVFKEQATWIEANNYAKSMGGNLVCVNNAEEFKKVCEMADNAGISVFWMGAKVNYAGQTWESGKWTNGDSFKYSYWYDGEPSGYEDGAEELYLMAFKVHGTWYFNDAVNDVSDIYGAKLGYIVEIEE